MQIPRMLAAFVLALWPAASAYCQEITEPRLTGEDWIDTFHCEPLESLYHTEEDFPESLNKLILAGPKSFSAIRKGLRCTDLKVRFTCLVALNNMGLSRDSIEIVGPWMEKALQDESPWVRTEAAWGLGKLPWPKAKDTLLAALLREQDQDRAANFCSS